MSHKPQCMRTSAAALISLLLLSACQAVVGEEATPRESKGLTVDSMDVLGLGPQIPEMKGYALRIRQITMEPGAVVAYHSHANRPIAVYVVSGEFTEVPNDAAEITRGPGTQWVEGAEMMHWGANRGQVPTVLIAVDIVPED